MSNIYEMIFNNLYLYPIEELNENNSKDIRASILALRESYRNNTPVTAYDEKSIRKAYMLAYYQNYMKLSYEITKRHIVENLINNSMIKRIKIVFFAAGPAPEASGVLKAFSEAGCSKRLEVSILDLEKGWEVERKVTSKLINNMTNLKISSLNHLSGCDLTIDCKKACSNWTSCENNIFQADLYFMENCINHMSKEVNFTERLKRKIEDLKTGALFTIIDLDYNNVKNVMKNLKFECVDTVDVISTNIDSEVSVSRLDIDIPKEIRKYIFDGSNGLIAKKNTNYYYIIMSRK